MVKLKTVMRSSQWVWSVETNAHTHTQQYLFYPSFLPSFLPLPPSLPSSLFLSLSPSFLSLSFSLLPSLLHSFSSFQGMEEMLGKFRTDLGSISAEIQLLQDQSRSMRVKLTKRQKRGGVMTTMKGCVNNYRHHVQKKDIMSPHTIYVVLLILCIFV